MSYRKSIAVLLPLIFLSRPTYAKSMVPPDLLTFTLQSHAGSLTQSITSSTSFGFSLRHFGGSSLFRVMAGGGFYASPSGQAAIASALYPVDIYGAEFMLGGAALPFSSAAMRPVLFANLLVGSALARLQSSTNSLDPISLSLTYGAQFGFGMQFAWGRSAIYLGAAYSLRRATRLIGQVGFELDSMTFELGLAF